jgi:hypothetical protein
VDRGVLETVLLLRVEDQTVLVQEGHDRRLPTRAPQEVYDDVEEPVLYTINVMQRLRCLIHSVLMPLIKL